MRSKLRSFAKRNMREGENLRERGDRSKAELCDDFPLPVVLPLAFAPLRPAEKHVGQKVEEPRTIIHNGAHTKSNRRERNRDRTLRIDVALLYWMRAPPAAGAQI